MHISFIKLNKLIKKRIKKNKILFWSFFHPDNLFKFDYANNAEILTWRLVTEKYDLYKSICEIGCFNGRISLILKDFIKGKTYIGYDLNLIAILIAKIISLLRKENKQYFHFANGLYASKEKCELFVSIATLIYFSEFELKKFIKTLKTNNSFKCLVMHEIFLVESNNQKKNTKVEDNLNIHSIAMICEEFGSNYKINIKRTFYSQWENNDRISALMEIKKI